MVAKRKVSEALTGVHLRTSTLPDPGISGLHNHRVGPEPFAATDESTRTISTNEIDDHAVRKCVYNYEDKYTFARILQNDSLIFDSHFESGNLHSAFRVFPPAGGSGASAAGSLSLHAENVKKTSNCFLKHQTYDLYMHNDCFTHGHTQWFYFSVKNVVVGQAIIFNIKNFTKSESLFTEGMRPLLLSTRSNRGWVRAGTGIKYCYSAGNNNNTNSTISDSFQPTSQHTQLPNCSSPLPADCTNPQTVQQSSKKEGKDSATGSMGFSDTSLKATSSAQSKQQQPPSQSSKPGSYALTFSHTFEFSEDLCYFAYCLPYTYTDLRKYLNTLEATPARCQFVRRTELCRTLAGNSCDLLTITAPSRTPRELNNRVGVVFTARVHPGESNASWIMQGILDCLTADNPAAIALREQYVFKIVPMLNPDGVINGNYRCSLAGVDLNRRWNNPDPYYHPTVYHTKQLILRMKRLRAVGIIVDIHGHSLKQGAFFYGCSPEKRLLRLRSSSPPLAPSPALSTRVGGQRDRKDGSKDNEGPTISSPSNHSILPVDIQEQHTQEKVQSLDPTVPESERPVEGTVAIGRRGSSDSGISMNKMAVAQGIYQDGNLTFSITPMNDIAPSTSDDRHLRDLTGAVVMTALPPSTPRGLQLPSKKSSLRDLLSWRVHLFPRICTALAPLFAAESCSYKLQKAKASTFRMVAFTELGVDCVYTLEASLAGLAPYHFGAQELLKIGEELCRGLIVAHPSVSASDACLHMNGSKTSQQTLPAVSTSVTSLLPSYERCGSEPHMLNRFKEILGLPGVGDERDDPLSENSMVTQSSSSSCGTVPVHVLSQRSIAPFLLEMQDWRPLYINNREMHHTGIAGRIISELGMSEITITAATELEDLSDEDEDPEKIVTTAFGRTSRVDTAGGKEKEKRKGSVKSGRLPFQYRERAPSAPLISFAVPEPGSVPCLEAGAVEGSPNPEAKKQQREKERKVTPSTPVIQPRRRSCGNFQVNMLYSSLMPKQAVSSSCKYVEGDADLGRDRDRNKGRMRGAGVFQSAPNTDRKAEDLVMISLSPTVQQLLQPSACLDPAHHGTGSKSKDKDSGSITTAATGGTPVSTPRRRPRPDPPLGGARPVETEVIEGGIRITHDPVPVPVPVPPRASPSAPIKRIIRTIVSFN